MLTRTDSSTHWPDGFSLSGPSTVLDPRVNAFRKDIADIRLAGQVIASHYARAAMYVCSASTTMIRAAASSDARATSQLIAGEAFALLDRDAEWGWGYCTADSYVGYVALKDLVAGAVMPTHRVNTPIALVFAEPDIKSPLRDRLPMGARLAALGERAGFIETDRGWIHLRHVELSNAVAPDAVAMAERLVGAPYLWGGRAGDGLDCSGLVQLALSFAGLDVPRDSDQQRDRLGHTIARDHLRRGDLVFVPGHVGMMVDEERLIHANAWWMAVTVEPLAAVLDRLRADGSEPEMTLKRL